MVILTWAAQRYSSTGPAPADFATSPTCKIGIRPGVALQPLKFSPAAERLPAEVPGLETAYFAMGCFWGSEAMLASCPGVEFTRVGFAGGSFPDPSYSAIGDHVETVEVMFDPEQVSYDELLDHFWNHHNASAKPIFRQYASAVFTTSPLQEKTAKAARKKRNSVSRQPILTTIRTLDRFYPASADHQKHYLSRDSELLAQLPRGSEQRLFTRLATKLNALAGQGGKQDDILQSLTELGVQPKEPATPN
jgi:peptide-methionine (S)-S-oxide reductase